MLLVPFVLPDSLDLLGEPLLVDLKLEVRRRRSLKKGMNGHKS